MNFGKAESATLRYKRPRAAGLFLASLLLAAVLALVPSTSALASLGDPDATFGGTGVVTAQNTSDDALAGNVNAVTTEQVGSNDDVVAAGQYTPSSGNAVLAIARFLPTGLPDTSFGTNGNGVDFPDTNPGVAYGVAANSAGTDIVAAGYDEPSGTETPVVSQVGAASWTARLSDEPQGRFDAVGYDPATGDVIAAGTEMTEQAPAGELVIAAYDASGDLDWSYQHTFSATSDGGDTVAPGAITFDSAGDIFVAASTPGISSGSSCAPQDTVVVELTSAGAYNTNFAGSGFEVIGSGTSSGSCGDSLPAGSLTLPGNLPGNPAWPAIVIGGQQFAGTGSDRSGNGTLLGLTSSGTIDTAWGSTGVVTAQCAPLSGSVTANTTDGSNLLTSVSDACEVQIGASISGTGIPAGTTVTAVASGTVTMSAEATATASGVTTTVTPTASSGGLVVAGSGGLLAANSVATVAGTGVVASGPAGSAGDYSVGTSFTVTSAGGLESQFGNNGTATEQPLCDAANACGQSVAVQANGDFLLGGGVSGKSEVNNPAESCTLSATTPSCSVQDDLSVARLSQQSISLTGPPSALVVTGATTASLTITLDGSSAASVQFATQSGTATGDFTPTSGTVTFPCGTEPSSVNCSGNTATVSVPILDPSGSSGTASFTFALSNPSGAGLATLSVPVTLDYVPATTSTTQATTSSTSPTSSATAPSVTPTTVAAPTPATSNAAPAAGKGYWVVTSKGVVKAIGDAKSYGSVSAKQLAGASVTAIAALPNGTGYFVVSSKGAIFAFGEAKSYGSVSAKSLSGSIRAIAVQTNGKGYWLVSSTGAVYAYGSAKSFGDVAKGKVSGTVEEIARTSNGKGYWLASNTGAVYHFGNAASDGQLLGKKHTGSVTSFAAVPNGKGYWLVTGPGVVYSYGKAGKYGSVDAKMKLKGTVVAITATPTSKGYWLTSSTGQVFAFGNAHDYGSASSGAIGTATT